MSADNLVKNCGSWGATGFASGKGIVVYIFNIYVYFVSGNSIVVVL
jgi:hypothetical protein